MLVIDASVVAPLVVDAVGDGPRIRQRVRGEVLAAPDLLHVEALSVIRRHANQGDMAQAQAVAALDDLLDLPVEVYPTASLLRRAWELHDTLTPYDACYVGLAESLRCPLLTADRRIVDAPGIRCELEVL